MIKLKSLLKENNQNLNIIIKRVDYDTNISGIVSMTFQGNNPSDKNDFQDIINDIKQDIESENDPTGAYDQTRLVSDITFDCEMKIGSDTIDFTVQAKAGRLVIFPPLCTYPHSGRPPISDDKFIIGTYLHYV